MMTIRGRLLATLIAFALAVPSVARAAGYPVNVCVGTKQKLAASYCKSAFGAWSNFETSGDAAKRDASLQKAATKLGGKWTKAETKSLAGGSDCAETTLSASTAVANVDSAIAAFIGQVNTGLDLGDKAQAKCGASIIKAAGSKCGAFLKAEAKYIRDLSKDPQGTKRDASKTKASGKFSAAFTKAACPTSATENDLESAVDAIAGDVVRDTTISPNVDDTQFTTITPTGPIQYLGKTLEPTCIHDTPYAFFVKRGSVNKLLVYYEGGGACWEQLTCSIPVCDATVKTDAGSGSDNPNFSTSGFASYTNPSNPFHDWNVVFISYCSCDIHFGDASQNYSNTDPMNPVHIEHRGFQNARVVEKWAREHFVNPDQVFVTGSSAGAYGAWFHAPLLHETWPASHFQVLADAGNGVVTQDFIDNFFPNWNFIGNIPPEFPEIADIITNGGGIPQYTEFVANRFPQTRWAHYATAYDGGQGGQTGFYNIMLHNNNPVNAVTWWQGSCQFNDVMVQQATDTYNDIHATTADNYRYYIGTGSRHTMWGSNKVYTDTTGGVPLLVDWVNAMLDGTNAWTNVVANDFGLLLAGDPRPGTLPTPPFYQVGSDVKVICPSSPSGAFIDAGGPFD
jgi:hypothetical protein